MRSERLSASLGEEKETTSNTNKKKETEVSQRLTNFVLQMYHQLISEQRSQIFALLQKKTARKEIADIVGISQSTLSREIKRNSTTKYLGVPVYFADPYCSWQKGAVENTNKLIRQYIPKKDSFDNYTDKRIMSIQKKLNERPREKLNFSTPKCEFFKHVL